MRAGRLRRVVQRRGRRRSCASTRRPGAASPATRPCAIRPATTPVSTSPMPALAMPGLPCRHTPTCAHPRRACPHLSDTTTPWSQARRRRARAPRPPQTGRAGSQRRGDAEQRGRFGDVRREYDRRRPAAAPARALRRCASSCRRVGVDHHRFAGAQRAIEQRPSPVAAPEARSDRDHVRARSISASIDRALVDTVHHDLRTPREHRADVLRSRHDADEPRTDAQRRFGRHRDRTAHAAVTADDQHVSRLVFVRRRCALRDQVLAAATMQCGDAADSARQASGTPSVSSTISPV